MDRLEEAIDEWQSAFDAGSDDPTTIDREGCHITRGHVTRTDTPVHLATRLGR